MEKDKKTILIFVDWYVPAYKAGGPIVSVSNLVSALSSYFNFAIITTNTDIDPNIPLQNIEANKWIERNKNLKVYYFSHENLNAKNLKKVINSIDYQVVYLNSMYSLYFSIVPVWQLRKKAKVVLAPRGMLGEASLEIKKSKKQVFLKLSQLINFYKNIYWHATSEHEKQRIENHFGKNNNIFIAQNLGKTVGYFTPKEKKDETRFFFLSRILPIKNLHFAIKIFENKHFNQNVIFDIYGPVEDENYWQECKSIISNLNSNVEINHKGELRHSEVFDQIKNYHFLLFPSLHENFGHAIAEALAASCPVIISNKTPWNKLEEKQAGWDISLENNQKFEETVQKCVEMSEKDYKNISEKAFELAQKTNANKELINKYVDFFTKL